MGFPSRDVIVSAGQVIKSGNGLLPAFQSSWIFFTRFSLRSSRTSWMKRSLEMYCRRVSSFTEDSMDRGEVLLQRLRVSLMGWFDFIRRATGAREVQFIPRPTGDFSIRVEWPGEKYVKDFTREFVFGKTFSTPAKCGWAK